MSKRNKPNEFYKFEASSTLQQIDGQWKHRYRDENGKEQTDTITQITYSMLISRAFKNLTPRQRMLYVYAKSQFFSARSRPVKDYKDCKELQEELEKYQGRNCFYLNHHLMSDVFELYPKSNTRDLYRDIEALIENGFIDCISNGKLNNKRSIYKFSDRWKEI